jgi:hypothetical protein
MTPFSAGISNCRQGVNIIVGRRARLLIEDVTLVKGEEVKVHVRFKSGATRSLVLPRQLAAFQEKKPSSETVREIDRLLDEYSPGEVAEILDAKGVKSGTGLHFHAIRVERIRRTYNLRSRLMRLREKGCLTVEEISVELKCSKSNIARMRKNGQLAYRSFKINDMPAYAYLPL